jgi:hypothetical protein
MTLRHIIFFSTIYFYSCNDSSEKISADKIQDTAKTEIIKRTEPDLSDITTPHGNPIKFKRNGDNFQVQWVQNSRLKTFTEYEFEVYGANSWLPRFQDENQEYVLMRAGCGSPCWLGLFLPLTGDRSAKLIHEYLAYDLDQNYVAFLADDSDSLEVLNLKSARSERFKLATCKAAFKGWCIDTIFFEGQTLKFSWDSVVNWQKKEKALKKLKISI